MDLTAAMETGDADVSAGIDYETGMISLAVILPGDTGHVSVTMTPAEAGHLAASLNELAARARIA